jgi:hypothetical protein
MREWEKKEGKRKWSVQVIGLGKRARGKTKNEGDTERGNNGDQK